jgi:hypothetical protein
LPNWTEPKEKQFACLIHEDEQRTLCLMFNAGPDAVDFSLPPVLPVARWHLAVDTSREAPKDLFAAGEEPLWEDPHTYHVSPRSSAYCWLEERNCQMRQTVDGGQMKKGILKQHFRGKYATSFSRTYRGLLFSGRKSLTRIWSRWRKNRCYA